MPRVGCVGRVAGLHTCRGHGLVGVYCPAEQQCCTEFNFDNFGADHEVGGWAGGRRRCTGEASRVRARGSGGGGGMYA